MNELRPIPGFPGYAASGDGHIWSTVRNWRSGPRCLAERPDRHGYLRVRVQVDGREVKKQVHGLVLLAFRGPSAGRQTRHLDGARVNNRIDNLAWGTAAENAADRGVHGTLVRGPIHHNSQKTHCPQGHEYTLENTAIKVGRRHCLTCKRRSDMESYHRRRVS